MKFFGGVGHGPGNSQLDFGGSLMHFACVFVCCHRFFADKSKERTAIAAAAVHLPSLEVQGLPEDISKYAVIFAYF